MLESLVNFRIVLKLVRKEKKLTQKSVAERCGLSINYVGRIERGISTPIFLVFVSLCNGLEVKMSDFAQKMNNLSYVNNSYKFMDIRLLSSKLKKSRFFMCNFLLKNRKVKGLTQINLAKKAKVNKTYYGFIERGDVNPTLDKIFNIINALNAKFYELLFYIENNW